DPPGGAFVRDAKTGEPTGAIKEDAADAVVKKVIPIPPRAERLQALRNGIKEANRVGLVRVHSAGGVSIAASDLDNAELFDELRKSGELNLRFYLAYRMNPPEGSEKDFAAIDEARRRYHDEWISAGAAKFFLDGVIETHTAAMLAPYSDDPSLKGSLWWEPAKYQAAISELDRRGVQVFTHAIGDLAIRTALDAYQTAAKQNGTAD